MKNRYEIEALAERLARLEDKVSLALTHTVSKPKIKPVGWINIYAVSSRTGAYDCSGLVYGNETEARRNAGLQGTTIKIEWEEA